MECKSTHKHHIMSDHIFLLKKTIYIIIGNVIQQLGHNVTWLLLWSFGMNLGFAGFDSLFPPKFRSSNINFFEQRFTIRINFDVPQATILGDVQRSLHSCYFDHRYMFLPTWRRYHFSLSLWWQWICTGNHPIPVFRFLDIFLRNGRKLTDLNIKWSCSKRGTWTSKMMNQFINFVTWPPRLGTKLIVYSFIWLRFTLHCIVFKCQIRRPQSCLKNYYT